MPTVYKEFFVNVPPQDVWEAVKDFGALHTRLFRGYVTDAVLSGTKRTITFANGVVAEEEIVSVLEPQRRLAWATAGETANRYNAAMQVFPEAGGSRVLWVVDVLPEILYETVHQMVEGGSVAMQRTLEPSQAQN